jgi:hypothetical protein
VAQPGSAEGANLQGRGEGEAVFPAGAVKLLGMPTPKQKEDPSTQRERGSLLTGNLRIEVSHPFD